MILVFEVNSALSCQNELFFRVLAHCDRYRKKYLLAGPVLFHELNITYNIFSNLIFCSPFRYQSSITDPIANVDNLKDIFENAMAVVGLTKEDVAKAALVQKTLSASGVTPAVLAQVNQNLKKKNALSRKCFF